jgi:DNA repair protein RecN (Recombination protein N)
MLVQLHIENYALIDRVVLEFGAGLNVLTGETGAGKSMIIGALGLVLGQRAQTDMVCTDNKPTLVEALFDLSASPQLCQILATLGMETDETSLLLKRLITKNSSRCYINANLATLTMLQDVGQHLIEILGQHQQQTLLRRESQLTLLDAFGRLGDDVATLRQAYQRYQELLQDFRQLRQEEQQRLQRQDLLRFQAEELDTARLYPTEEEQLAAEHHLLLNAEQIYELSQSAYALLYRNERSLLELLATVRDQLAQLAQLDPRQSVLSDELHNSYYTLEEVAQRLRDYSDSVEIDPNRLHTVEERLAEIARLKRKYGATIPDILQYRERIRHEYLALTQHEERRAALTAELGKLRQALKSLAITLSDKRRQAAERLQQAVQQELEALNMAGTVFRIACTLRHDPQGDVTVGTERVALTADGIDEVEYLVAPNPGQPLKPLARIASGGELSRLMLAMKSILARADQTPTLVLDEVDAGIGGRTARIVGEKLRHLAHSHQVFCITHLPQIASHGDQHYRVEKSVGTDHTTIQVQPLSFAERVEEIARMSGGTHITAATRKHAEEMLTKRP